MADIQPPIRSEFFNLFSQTYRALSSLNGIETQARNLLLRSEGCTGPDWAYRIERLRSALIGMVQARTEIEGVASKLRDGWKKGDQFPLP